MKIELIDSAGKSSLQAEYKQMLFSTRSFDIASAFITEAAVELLEQTFKKNTKLNGRLLTGLYHCFNTRAALLKLLDLSRRYANRFNVKISRDPRFHWKYYHFNGGSVNYLYIGSANFTGAGMTQSGELQLKASLTKKDRGFLSQCNNRFNQAWEHAVQLQEIPWQKYRSLVLPKSMAPRLDRAIHDMLFTAKEKKTQKLTMPLRLVETLGALMNSTIKKVSEEHSNWDKQQWDYFSCYNKRIYDLFESGQCHFLISKTGGNYTFHYIKVVDKDRILTEEGNYFVAYKEVKRFRTETSKLLKMLMDIGIVYRTNKNIERQLTKRQSEAIGSFFGV